MKNNLIRLEIPGLMRRLNDRYGNLPQTPMLNNKYQEKQLFCHLYNQKIALKINLQ